MHCFNGCTIEVLDWMERLPNVKCGFTSRLHECHDTEGALCAIPMTNILRESDATYLSPVAISEVRQYSMGYYSTCKEDCRIYKSDVARCIDVNFTQHKIVISYLGLTDYFMLNRTSCSLQCGHLAYYLFLFQVQNEIHYMERVGMKCVL